MTLLILCVLATVAVHRIWNYEEIFAPVRASLGAKVLIDPAWNGLWIAPLVVALAWIPHEAATLTLAMFACYPILRGLVAVHEHFSPECSPCEKKQKAMHASMQALRAYAKRIIILGSDLEQANKLADKHQDWIITLFGLGDEPKKMRKNVAYKKVFPPTLHVELQNFVFLGGDATVVSWGVTHTQPWAQAIELHKDMKAVAWIHVGRFDPAMVPAHHRVIAYDEPLDTVIMNTPART